MQEYVKITQSNQEMLGKISIETKTEPLLSQDHEPSKEIPILTGFVDPPAKKEELPVLKQECVKRP